MQTNPNNEVAVTVKATGEKLKVYKLKEGTPTKDHIWADATTFTDTSQQPFASRTFTESELSF